MYVIWFMLGCLTTFDIMCYLILRYFERNENKEKFINERGKK